MRLRTTRVLPVVPLIAALSLLAACSGGSSAPKAAPTSAAPTPSPSPVPPKPKPTCPLTGRPPTKYESLRRVPLAVKIDNVDLARPQSGIDRADIVFEETVEGGLTRLFAVFQCDSSSRIGPVRSGRTSDASMLRLFHGSVVFAYSGSNYNVGRDLVATSHAVLLSYGQDGGLFYRSGSRPAPHNVYTSTQTLLRAGVARKKGMKPPHALFVYSTKVPAGQRDKRFDLRWSGFASAGWVWFGHRYNRIQNGTPDVLDSGKRIGVDNVIVMRIQTRDLGLRDVLGNPSPDDVLTGHGQVWVFRDGRRISGHWSRPNLNSPLRFIHNGHLIALHPGRTWIELLPGTGSLSFR